jgi:RND family efflux transporter MFP subunit
VEFTTVQRGDAQVEVSAIGQVVSFHSVAVRPQVTGTLTAVYFTEGDEVKAGQKLFSIDAAPYRAALAQAEGQLAKDRATALAAEIQEQRLVPLADKGYVTGQDLLDAKAATAEARAAAEASAAAVAAAKVTVSRTLITAPIAGRTGSLTVKAGNIVSATDTNPLVTINQLHPVQAQFSVPQTQLLAVQQAAAKGTVAVTATGQETGALLGKGRLVFIDNTVDASTGTVKLKAEFDNPQETLWPGTFVTLNATLSVEHDVVLVPEQSVQAGASGAYVYVVGDDLKAVLTPVKVARQTGGNAVISQGVQGGERIVARVPRDLTPNAKVVDAKSTAKPDAKANDGQPQDSKAAPVKTGSTP